MVKKDNKNEEEIKKEKKTKKEETKPENKDLKDDKKEEKIDDKQIIVELNDKFLRLNAEFSNFKKRTEKEKSDIYKYANEKLIMSLLPVIDNMNRALLSIEEAKDHKLVIEGVNLVKKSFDDFLTKNGVEIIKAVGEKFDPSFHHAIMIEENDKIEDEIIIDEFERGYKLNDKVIRPSMVKVSKKNN